MIHIQHTGKVIPWKAKGSISEVKLQVNRSDIADSAEFKEDVNLYIKLVDLNKFREKVVISRKSHTQELYLVVTNFCVYLMTSGYSIRTEIVLGQIKQAIFTSSNVEITSERSSIVCDTDSVIVEKIKLWAALIRNDQI